MNKLGINIPPRDLEKYKKITNINKPLIIPPKPKPNIFISPIEDTRNLDLIKKDLNFHLNKFLGNI